MTLSVSLSKLSFTLLIWRGFAVDGETSCLICSLYVKCESRTTPRSFALNTGIISLPSSMTLSFLGSLFNNWGVPIRRNLVFSGLISNSLAEHHLATRQRSSSRFALVKMVSLMEKDRKTLESSTYDSSELLCGDSGRSFRYMRKNKGESIAPCGRAFLWGRPCESGHAINANLILKENRTLQF